MAFFVTATIGDNNNNMSVESTATTMTNGASFASNIVASGGGGSSIGGIPVLPLLCGLIVVLAFPEMWAGRRRRGGGAAADPKKNEGSSSKQSQRSTSGWMCDVWAVLTALVCLAAWVQCDLHFEGREILRRMVMEDEAAAASTSYAREEEVTESILNYCGKSSLILGTAAILELFQVLANRMAVRNDGPDQGKPRKKKEIICTLFGWHDSECMLLVYSILCVVHVCMMYDANGEDLGLVFAEPLAAASGVYRPISTIRYIEWTFASPILMILVGRSMPRIKNADVNEDTTCASSRDGLAHTLRPGLVVTMAYMLPAWQALLVVEPFWRWALIFVSLGGFCFSTLDQMTAWRRNIDRSSPCFWTSDFLLKLQILVYFAYGIVYLLALFDLLSPTAEQAVFTFSDSTIKLSCSAALAAMRHADALAEARRSRIKSDLIADDLQRMIKDSAAPIFAVDNEYRVTIWNDKLVILTELRYSQVIGKHISDLLSQECKDEVMAIFGARKSGMFGAERFHCDLNGENNTDEEGDNGQNVVSLVMSASARRDADGNIVGIVGIGQDTTEVTCIRAIEEKKDQLMAVVSHELKSPLHGIIGLSESLAQSEKVETRKDQLKMVKSCANRLLDLVSNIMQMSKLRREGKGEGGTTDGVMSKVMLRKDPVDVSSILAEVCMLVSNATDKAMKPILNPLVRLENKAPKNLPIVEGDSYKITQVFYNLLTNACKFCTSGSITVKVGLNGAKDMLEIAISDTGVGIAADSVKRIFGEYPLLCLM